MPDLRRTRALVSRLLVSLGAAAAANCGGASSPTSPTPVASTLLAPGSYVLNIAAPVDVSGCTGASTTPVQRRDLGVTLQRFNATTVVIATGGWQGDLSLRLTESNRATTGLLASVDGVARGVGHSALGPDGPALSVRLADNVVRGQATTGGATGEITGPIVFITSGAPDVTCTTARWSMARLQP